MPPKKKGPDEPERVGAARFGRCKGTMKMGLVGLPNVGKSSLFNLFTEQSVPAENFPFCTIEPTEARCEVPDERFRWLCDLWKPPAGHEIPPYLSVTDIAGLIRGAASGAGLGNEFLSTITSCDGIFHVVRAFDDADVIHVDDSIDPVRDLDTIHGELCAKDLDFVRSAEAKEKQAVAKDRSSKLSATFIDTFAKMIDGLENGLPVRDMELTNEEVWMVNEKTPSLLTTKPIIYLVNLSEKDFLRKKNKHLPKIKQWIDEHGGGLMVPFSVAWEEGYQAAKGDEASRAAFLEQSYGAEVPKLPSALTRIIKQGFKQLGLIYFFTAGEPEVRAWTVFGGATAPQCAGVIHTDFEKGFIKAEVISWEAYKKHITKPSTAEAKGAGEYKQMGKEYTMIDGDVVHFMFNTPGAKKK